MPMTNAKSPIRSFELLSQVNRKKRSKPLKTKTPKQPQKQTGKVSEQAFAAV